MPTFPLLIAQAGLAGSLGQWLIIVVVCVAVVGIRFLLTLL